MTKAKVSELQQEVNDISEDEAFAPLKRTLSNALKTDDVVEVLMSAIADAQTRRLFAPLMSREMRDALLPMVADLHGKALTGLSCRLTAEQIDDGMQAFAAHVILLAETYEQKALRSPDALRDIGYRLKLFRNLLENITLAEALASNLREECFDDAIVRYLGRPMSAAA